MYPWTRKNRLHYGSHPRLDLDIGIFIEGCFNIPRWGIFHNLTHIPEKKQIGLR